MENAHYLNMQQFAILILGWLAIGASAYAQGDVVPDYMASHLDGKIEAINQCRKSSGADGDAFIFVADTHTLVNSMLSARLAQAICRRRAVNKVIFGGDAVVAYGSERDMYNCARRQAEAYDTYVAPYAKVYNVLGNHDIIIKDISDKKHPKSYTASDEERFFILLKGQESSVQFDKNNRLGGYFYFDNPEQKIRYIGLNGWERHADSHTTWTAISGFSPRQAQWLIDEALVMPSEGWTVVIFMHASVAVGKRGGRECAPFEVLRGIVSAFAQHTTYAFKGEVARYHYDLKADFTKSSGIVATFMAGHYHQDRFIYDGNVAHVVVNCDARYNDDVVRRKVNTVTECSFDVVLLNKREKKITLIKVGAGFDRSFHYDSRLTMSPGGTRTLRSELSGELVWSSSDKTVATAENGIVQGMHKGSATIVVADDKQNKEFFDVVVR